MKILFNGQKYFIRLNYFNSLTLTFLINLKYEVQFILVIFYNFFMEREP